MRYRNTLNASNLKYTLLLIFFFMMSTFTNVYGQLIDYETKITVDKRGRKTTKNTILIQINNKDEKWLSEVQLKHTAKQKIRIDYAEILDSDGNLVRKLKKKEIKERHDISNRAFYQDQEVTEFYLNWNEYPYRIKYSYQLVEDEYLYLAWWSPVYNTNVKTMNASLEVNVPSGYGMNIKASSDLSFTDLLSQDRQVLKWQSGFLELESKNEIYSSPLDFPSVKIIPRDFNYGLKATVDSWSSFGHWFDLLNKDSDGLTSGERLIINQLVEDTKDKKMIVRGLYHHLQDHTSYINVAIDVGGMKSYPASYVCDNKYGDCKALTTYMKSMLKEFNIESYYALINAGQVIDTIDTNTPSQQFNHVILMVPVDHDTIWLENTSTSFPYNYLGTFTQGRHVLMIDGDKSQLVKTPRLRIDDVRVNRNFEYSYAKYSKFDVNLDIDLRGEEFENLRYYINENDGDNELRAIVHLSGLEQNQIKNWEIKDFQRDSTFIKVKVNGGSLAVIKEIGKYRVVNPLKIIIPNFENPNVRTRDVQISFPINKIDKSIYNLKGTDEVQVRLPENIEINSKFGNYKTRFEKEQGRIVITESFILFANTISQNRYSEFYDFIESIKNAKKKSTILLL